MTTAPGGSVVVVIPVLNEAESIGRVVTEIRRQGIARIIVADGGSADGTQGIAAEAGAQVLEAGRGYGRACLAGALAADPGSTVVFMDGDGADDPGLIGRMVASLQRGEQDLVIGSRVRGTRERGSMAWHQIAAGLGAGLLIRLLYKVSYTDMCAFRAMRRETLLALGMREMTYGWNLEMQMRAARAGLRVLEIPVPCRRRLGGTSNVSGTLRGTVKAGRQIIGTFWRVSREGTGGAAARSSRG